MLQHITCNDTTAITQVLRCKKEIVGVAKQGDTPLDSNDKAWYSIARCQLHVSSKGETHDVSG
jgi:hypothetical protein